MIPKGLFAQIGMVVVSIAIIVTYVEPAFSDIGEVQDNISTYRSEREKVATVNDQLQDLVQVLERIPARDVAQLQTYLPDEVDTIAVPRDLAFMAVEAGVVYRNAAFVGVEESNGKQDEESVKPQAYRFSYTVEGSYEEIKDLLRIIARNNYPLEIQQLDVRRLDGDFLEATMQLTTYAYQPDPTLATDEELIN